MGLGTAYGQWSIKSLDEVPSVILACGPESSLKQEMIDDLREAFPDDDREVISLYADESDPPALARELDSQGLFTEKKWIVLKQLGLKENGQYQLARYFDVISDYVDDPEPDTLLVLCDEAHPYQKGRKIGSMAHKIENGAGEVVVFWEPFERELYQRIRSLFEEHDLGWETGAIEALVERSEGKMARIQQEAEKLVDFYESGDDVTRADVERIVSSEEASDSYKALKHAMISESPSSILDSLDEFYRQSSSGAEIGVTHTVLSYLRDLRDIKRSIRDGQSLGDALEERGIPSSKGIKKDYRRALGAVRDRFPNDFFREGYDLLRDVKYKRSPMNRRALDKFMLETVSRIRK